MPVPESVPEISEFNERVDLNLDKTGLGIPSSFTDSPGDQDVLPL